MAQTLIPQPLQSGTPDVAPVSEFDSTRGFGNVEAHIGTNETARAYNSNQHMGAILLAEVVSEDHFGKHTYDGAIKTLATMGTVSEDEKTRTFRSGEITVHSDGSYGRPGLNRTAKINEHGKHLGSEREPDFRFGTVGGNKAPVMLEITDGFDFMRGSEPVDTNEKIRKTTIKITPVAGAAKTPTEEKRLVEGGEATEVPVLAMGKTHTWSTDSRSVSEVELGLVNDRASYINFTRTLGFGAKAEDRKISVSVKQLVEDQISMNKGQTHGLHYPDWVHDMAYATLWMVDGMFEDAAPQLEAVKDANIAFQKSLDASAQRIADSELPY